MLSLYRKLLLCYPAEYREQFGQEMAGVFVELKNENENYGVIARATFLLREITGLLRGALRERLRTIGVHNGLLLDPRRFAMRNEFRFPKTTAVLMAIILAGVILAIRRGEAIATSLPHVNPQLPPIQPVHSVLLSGLPLFFAFFYAAGLIGWIILFAMRRSGVHRLDDMAEQRK